MTPMPLSPTRRDLLAATAAAAALSVLPEAGLTNTAVSSARLYWDTTQISNGAGFFDVRGVKIPVAVSAFPNEIYAAPRSWAKRAYPKLIYYNKLAKGGHFAAWEQPELFTAELRTAFRPLRA